MSALCRRQHQVLKIDRHPKATFLGSPGRKTARKPNVVHPTPPAGPRCLTPRGRTRCETLQLWTQIVGKVRLALTPWLNHSWHVTLYVTARGLATPPIPLAAAIFSIEFDFIDHVLWLRTSDGHFRQLMLRPMSVAEFYADVMVALARARHRRAHQRDAERDSRRRAVPRGPRAREPTTATRAALLPRAAVVSHEVFSHFRTGFLGKASPVHFFWGSFDLAVTRFSGRRGAAAPGRGAEPAGRGGARGLFARGVERGLLAGRRGRSIIRRSIPTPIRRRRVLRRRR